MLLRQLESEESFIRFALLLHQAAHPPALLYTHPKSHPVWVTLWMQSAHLLLKHEDPSGDVVVAAPVKYPGTNGSLIQLTVIVVNVAINCFKLDCVFIIFLFFFFRIYYYNSFFS